MGERGDRLRKHISANSEGYSVPEILSNDLRDKAVAKKGVIFMDRLSMTPVVHRWCLETENFYHIGSENLAELSGCWVTSKELDPDINAAMDMK